MATEYSSSEITIDSVELRAGGVSLPELMAQSVSAEHSTGFIEQNPKHWSIEAHVPIELSTLTCMLADRLEITGEEWTSFLQQCDAIKSKLHERAAASHTQFEDLYLPFDPDDDSYHPPNESPATSDVADRVVQLCKTQLTEAGYRELDRSEIEECVGVASQWGVPLRVDFDLFDQLIVCSRGEVVGSRLCRRLRKLYRPEMVEVPIYQRLVVLFRLRDDMDSGEELLASGMHLRMFKNIPKQDVDMLLPGGRVKISSIDGLKIILPTLGGMAMSFQRFAKYALAFAIVAFKSTALMIGLAIAAVIYLARSALSYFQTKQRYLLNLTRNLYFQKLDTNIGVGYRIIQQAHRQRCVEAILAYYAVVTVTNESEDATTGTSRRRLRRRCERIIREEIDIEVAFSIDRAVEALQEQKLVQIIDDRIKLIKP